MSEQHTDALVAKTQEIAAFAQKTFVTLADHGTEPPYIVWHPASGVNTSGRITGPRVTKNPEYTGHIVGESAAQVQRLTDLLEEKLFPGGRGVVLGVEGENPKPLRFACPLPIQVQTDPQPTVIYAVVEVGWSTQPV